MIWFNLDVLLQKISKNELTDKDGFNYLLAFALTLLVLSFSLNYVLTSTWLRLVEIVLTLLITLWGLRGAYEVNENRDAKDFLKRFLAISWVVNMKILFYNVLLSVILATIFAFYAVITGNAPSMDPFVVEIVETFYLVVLTFIFYRSILVSFKRLSAV
jgi:hypothetical protein